MASVDRHTRNGAVTWQARYRDAAGRQRKRTFVKRADAERYLTGVRSRLLDGSYVDPGRGRMSLGEWSQQWLAGRAHLKPSTQESYASLLRSRVLPRWADVPLARVSHGEIVAWLAAMSNEGLSASRTRQAHHVLRAMLDAAVRDNRLSRNPAASVDLPRLPTSERRYLTHAQVSQLADASGPYGTLVLTLAYTGLRWGEAAALRVGRVDLLRGRLEVVEAVSAVNGHRVYGSPKSHAHRSVPVPKFLRDDLAAAMAGKSRDDLVFTSSRGAPLSLPNFRRRTFDLAVADVGLDGLTPHELRHTAASLAIASGASVKSVQRMLGHKSATMTLDVYGHLFEDDLDTVAERLDTAARKVPVPLVCPDATVTTITQRETGF